MNVLGYFSGFRGRLCLAFLFLFSAQLLSAQWAPLVTDADAAQRITWWREARFGMFLHWGVYSIPGHGEWAQWFEQIPPINTPSWPTSFIPNTSTRMPGPARRRQPVLKYMVLTARHHDGFALFDDPVSSFTAMKSAAHHDFVADYVKAVRQGRARRWVVLLAARLALPRLFLPGIYPRNAAELRQQYDRQIDELALHYGKLDVLSLTAEAMSDSGSAALNLRAATGRLVPKTTLILEASTGRM